MARASTRVPEQASSAHPAVSDALAIVLHDLAWLLPRTLDLDAEGGADPLPPTELEVMRLLVRRPGLTVGEVARRLGLQRPNASAAIRTLIGRGLLRRSSDPADGRVAHLTPTARAIENRDRREAAWGAALAAHLKRMPPEQAAQILRCTAPLHSLASSLSADV